MTVTSQQVELVARRVTDSHLQGPNKWDRDVDDRMTREAAAPAVYNACRELMSGFAGQAAPSETLIDVKHSTGYSTAGLRGFKATVRLLVATDSRIWFCRHQDGAIQQLEPVDYASLNIERKRISFGWPKLDGTTVTCGGATAEWLTAMRSGHHQPQAWLNPWSSAPATAVAQGGPPPGWHSDPYRRFELRYWDGSRWTPHVSTRGVAAQDPVG